MATPAPGPTLSPAADRERTIVARGLGRVYRDRIAVTGLDLDVASGEIFGLVGPDGAGKTTVLQMLAGILDPSTGSCTVLGADTLREAGRVNSIVGYMSQGFTLYDRLTVDENLAFAAGIRGVDGATYRNRRRELLEMAGLLPFIARRAGALSGGMRKKLSLCTNLVHRPRVLLLDEPSLGVDPLSRRELWQLFERECAAGTAIVLSTCYMDEASRSDRVVFLSDGRPLATGAPGELARTSTGSLLSLTANDVAAALATLHGDERVRSVQRLPAELRVRAVPSADLEILADDLSRLGPVRPVEATLEDAFVTLAEGDSPAEPVSLSAPATIWGDHGGLGAHAITVRFGDFTAVDAVTFQLAPGEVVGWVGPNGAGKTTLIRVLCGLLIPTTGTARVAGVDVVREPRRLRERIGYMSQRFSLYHDLTAGENLRFFAGAYGLGRVAARAAISEMMAVTGLADYGARAVAELSAAQRQRLALACAILHRPAILFLDEPTSGVDPVARQRFWQVVETLAAQGMTVMVTTHNLEEAYYCHRIGLMHQGRLLALDDIDGLRAELGVEADASVEFVFAGFLAREQG